MWMLFFMLVSSLLGMGSGLDAVHAETVEDQVFFSSNPGGDRPDDSYKYLDSLYPTDFDNLSLQEDPSSPVAILKTGYWKAAKAMTGLHTPVSLFAGGTPSRQTGLLVIPSGALSETGDGTVSEDALAGYVRQGGILLVMTQPRGEDFQRLPVERDSDPLRGYGWLEDQSAFYPSAYPVSGWKPLSGLTGRSNHLNVDGFFTSLPKRAVVLLRHAVNGQPVLIYYRYGKGGVFASTFFTDWAYLHQRAAREEIDFFGKMLSDALSPERREEAARGDEGRSNLPPLTYAVLSDHEIYTLGSTATFTIMTWNNTSRERWVNVYYEQRGHKIRLLPQRSTQITYTTKIHSSHRLWVYFHDENGRFLETLTRGVQVLFIPPLQLSWKNLSSPEEGIIKPGSPLSYALEISGERYNEKKIGVEVAVFAPDHRVIHSEKFKTVLEEKGANRTIRFTLPETAVGGTYILTATALNEEGEKIGGDSATLDLPLSLVLISTDIPRRILAHEKSEFVFSLHNSGEIGVEKGGFAIQMRDPSGRIFYEASLPFSLSIGEKRELRFKVPFPDLLIGEYTLVMNQWDETRRGISVPIDLSNEVEVISLFNQRFYRVRDTADLSLKVANQGPFEMASLRVLCEIPAFSFQQSEEISLAAFGEGSLTFRFQIPEASAAGPHDVKISFQSGGSSLTRTFPLELPSSELTVLS
jgi:hypothetical protein